MDDKSFHQGMLIGMRTAQTHFKAGSPSWNAIGKDIDEIKEAMERLYPGSKREMRALDIFLPMPLMTAADIGLDPQP